MKILTPREKEARDKELLVQIATGALENSLLTYLKVIFESGERLNGSFLSVKVPERVYNVHIAEEALPETPRIYKKLKWVIDMVYDQIKLEMFNHICPEFLKDQITADLKQEKALKRAAAIKLRKILTQLNDEEILPVLKDLGINL